MKTEVLTESKSRLLALADSLQQIVWVTQADGRPLVFNQCWYDYTGLSAEDSVDVGWTESLHPDDLARAIERWKFAIETGRTDETEYRLRAADGSYRWFLGRVLPQRNMHGEVLCWLCTCTDIDAQKRAEERLLGIEERFRLRLRQLGNELGRRERAWTAELALANELLQSEVAERIRAEQDLRDADRRKDEFLATLAHELRNPLAPIRNALEIMRLAGDAPRVVDANRELIARQIKQLVRLIDDLLEMARISFGTFQLRQERVDLARIIAVALECVRPLIDSRRHRLSVTLPEAPIELDADPARLVQILQHLLGNAAKYMEPGGNIWLTAQRDGREVLLSVKDSGFGIPADMLCGVFEMFAQVTQTRQRAPGGLGIGLPLVKALVQLHGGSAQARSAGIDQGSEFLVRLPLP
jgi:two-component system CheB/CheR fusion protein